MEEPGRRPMSDNSQRLVLAAIKSLLTYAFKVRAIAFNTRVALPIPRPTEALNERIIDESDVLMIRTEKVERNRILGSNA